MALERHAWRPWQLHPRASAGTLRVPGRTACMICAALSCSGPLSHLRTLNMRKRRVRGGNAIALDRQRPCVSTEARSSSTSPAVSRRGSLPAAPCDIRISSTEAAAPKITPNARGLETRRVEGKRTNWRATYLSVALPLRESGGHGEFDPPYC